MVQKDRPLERKLNHVKLMKGNITLCVRASVRVRVGGGGGSQFTISCATAAKSRECTILIIAAMSCQ